MGWKSLGENHSNIGKHIDPSDHFQNQLKHRGINPSFAFIEQPQTNGVAERFIRTLKKQVIYGRVFQNLNEVQEVVRGLVETYNREWLVEKNGFLSPSAPGRPKPFLNFHQLFLKKPGASRFLEILPWLVQQNLKRALPLLRIDDPNWLAELRPFRITPYLYKQIMCHSQEKSLPAPVLRGLAHDYALALRAAASQEQEARRLLQALHQADVEFILLKGADLRLRVYGDPAVRPMTGLDLLIDPAQLHQGMATLARLGYSPAFSHREPRPGFREQYGHEMTFAPPPGGRLIVDLHWEIRAVACYYRLPFDFLQSQSIFWDHKNLPVKVLTPEHALIHLSLHTFGDSIGAFPEALPLLDLALVLTRLPLDWSRFLQELAKCHCQLPIYCVFRELSRLVPQSIPGAVLTQLKQFRPPFEEKLLIRLIRSLRFLAGKFPRLEDQHHFWEWATFYLASFRSRFPPEAA